MRTPFYEMLEGTVYLTHFTYDEKKLDAELMAFAPQEVLLEPKASGKPAGGVQLEQFCKQRGFITTFTSDELTHADAQAWVASCTLVSNNAPLDSVDQRMLLLLGGYIKKHAPLTASTQKTVLRYQAEQYLQLDAATQKNLELVHNMHDGSSANTLFQVIDQAVTAMGSRLMKKWLVRPLLDRQALEQRLERVDYFVKNSFERNHVRSILKKMGDLERVVGRIALARAQLADYQALHAALGQLPALAQFIAVDGARLARLHALLDHALQRDEHTAGSAGTEGKIAVGYHDELDRLRTLATQGVSAIFALEQREQRATGITTLKIRYTHVSGYALELSKAQAENAPMHYIKLQSLTNRDRFTTPELKDLEYDINRAQAASVELENQLFAQLIREVALYVPALRTVVSQVAAVDLFAAWADLAVSAQWVKPAFTAIQEIAILDGRHPVVDARLRANARGGTFVANDTVMNAGSRTWIITGPNMGGKSTYLRQVALIQILAQIGCYVPARAATVPLIDRIFTRIGAGDSVAEGKSTFLVEMEETALICKHATQNSLVILDEVGRGTSTYDGLALAQAIVEYLHETSKPLCLFATHYHELCALGAQADYACYHAASKPVGDTVVLLHKIVPGIAQGSFGIQVAISAKIPQPVIARARALLGTFQNTPHDPLALPVRQSFSGAAHGEPVEPPCEAWVRDIDLDAITPRQAYDMLCKFKESL